MVAGYNNTILYSVVFVQLNWRMANLNLFKGQTYSFCSQFSSVLWGVYTTHRWIMVDFFKRKSWSLPVTFCVLMMGQIASFCGQVVIFQWRWSLTKVTVMFLWLVGILRDTGLWSSFETHSGSKWWFLTRATRFPTRKLLVVIWFWSSWG